VKIPCLVCKKAEFFDNKVENNFLASLTATKALSCSATFFLYSSASSDLVWIKLANYDYKLSNLLSSLPRFFLPFTNLGLKDSKSSSVSWMVFLAASISPI